MRKRIFQLCILIMCALSVLCLAACDSKIKQEPKTTYEVTVKVTEEITDEITEHKHNFGEWTVIKSADCMNSGIEERICVCGEKETQEIPADKNAHNFRDWYVTWDGNCKFMGTGARICKICRKIETRNDVPSDINAHNFGIWVVTKSANCTNTGTEERMCSFCWKIETREIPADINAHNFVSTVKKSANCTENGIEEIGCTICGNIETKEIPKIAHNFVSTVKKSANCTENGIEEIGCTICGKKETKEIPVDKNAHNFLEWKVTKPADCITIGIEERTCICGEKETREIPAYSHKYVRSVVSATDGKNVYTEHRCSVCGDCYLGSDGLEYYPNYDGTCYVAGIGTCRDTKVIIPPLSPEGRKVTAIGFEAFFGEEFSSIEIPDSITSIESHAFEYCKNLTSILIPKSVIDIGLGAFSSCSGLINLEVESGNPVYHCEGNCIIISILPLKRQHK